MVHEGNPILHLIVTNLYMHPKTLSINQALTGVDSFGLLYLFTHDFTLKCVPKTHTTITIKIQHSDTTIQVQMVYFFEVPPYMYITKSYHYVQHMYIRSTLESSK